VPPPTWVTFACVATSSACTGWALGRSTNCSQRSVERLLQVDIGRRVARYARLDPEALKALDGEQPRWSPMKGRSQLPALRVSFAVVPARAIDDARLGRRRYGCCAPSALMATAMAGVSPPCRHRTPPGYLQAGRSKQLHGSAASVTSKFCRGCGGMAQRHPTPLPPHLRCGFGSDIRPFGRRNRQKQWSQLDIDGVNLALTGQPVVGAVNL
jgi:hypothetical protein